MTRRNYSDETILTLTISSGTRDLKSQPFRYTAKSKSECDRSRICQQVAQKMKLLKRGKRSNRSLRM